MSQKEEKKIISLLHQCDIPITEADFTKPDKLCNIYLRLAEILTPNELDYEEKYREILESALDQKDLYEEALRELRMYRKIKKLTDGAAIADFSVKDIYDPDKKRTISILSQIFKFGEFRELKIDHFNQFGTTVHGYEDLIKTEYDHQYEIQCEIQNIKQLQESEEPKIQQLLVQNEELITSINNLNKLQYELKEKASELKKKNKDLRFEIKNCSELIFCTVQDITKLEEDIVENPQVLLTLIDEKRQRVATLKNNISDLEKSIRSTQLKIDLFSKADKELDKCLDLLHSTTDEISKANHLKNEKKKLKSTVEEKKQKLTDLENTVRLNDRKVLNTNDRIQRFTQKNQQKVSSHRKNLKEAKNEEKENNEVVIEINQQTQQQKIKLQNLKQKMENFEKSQKELTNSFQQRFDSLVTDLHSYQTRLLQEMKASSSS